MKIAALILAHKNKEQLERLISVMTHPFVDIYIHLDQKSSLSPFDFWNCNVRFTEKRFDVRLFDFSMVDAEMELIHTALSHERYSYYILLSGQDYPLRHVDDIYNYLCISYPKPLIEVISPEIVTMFGHVFRYPWALKRFKINSEAFLRKLLPNKSIYPYKYVPEGIVLVSSWVKRMFIKSPKQRLKSMGIEPYFGSQWWILPDIVVDEIFSFYNNEDFCRCIKDCYTCDEAFFQTAVMVFADRFGITLNEKGYYPNKKWFAIFSHQHPVVLTKNHFDQLVSSNKLFARKFDINTDATILDMLDKHNLNLKNQTIQD
jgi:hypothetical protein